MNRSSTKLCTYFVFELRSNCRSDLREIWFIRTVSISMRNVFNEADLLATVLFDDITSLYFQL